MKHPYPQRIVDDVADYLKPYTSSRIEAGSLAHQVLNRIWKASRVDSVEDAKKLPAGTKLINDKGIFVAEAVHRYDFYAEEFPAHVIYWGDSDE